MSDQNSKISHLFTELTALRIVVQGLVGRRALETNDPRLFIENLKAASIDDLSRASFSEAAAEHDNAIRDGVREEIERFLGALNFPQRAGNP